MAAMLDGRNNEIFLHEIFLHEIFFFFGRGENLYCSCHITWPPSNPPSLINNRRPFRVTLRLGSLGWQDRVTLWGEPTFSHVNRFKRVNLPSRSKTRHAEHAQADISVP